MGTTPRPTVDLAANCACGGVSVRLAGRLLAMFHCSCEDCQKATGTGHSSVMLAGANDLIVTGEARSFSRPAHSGAILTRWFCAVCGTPLYAQSSRAEGVVMVPPGLFAGQTEWFASSQLIFARSHQEWDTIDPALPRYDTYRDAKGSP